MRNLFAIGTLGTLVALSGCAIVINPGSDDVQVHTIFGSSGVAGDGRVMSEARPVAALAGLDVSGPLEVNVRVGGQPGLTVEADSNLLPMIRTEVRGDTLRVWVEGNVSSHTAMRVTYNVAQLREVHASGSGRLSVSDLNGSPFSFAKSGSGVAQLTGTVANLDVQSTGSGAINASTLHSGRANVRLSGSGRVTLGQVVGDSFTANINGSGELQASGTVQHLTTHVHGSGGANLVTMSSEYADLTTAGSGDISAKVTQSIVAQTNGSGRITVYGNPAQRNILGQHVQVVQ
jgi:hypothetical protein